MLRNKLDVLNILFRIEKWGLVVFNKEGQVEPNMAETTRVVVDGMTCIGCSSKVKEALEIIEEY